MNDAINSSLATSLSKAMERLFRIGGFGLAFGFIGLVLTVIANLSNAGSAIKLLTYISGSILIFICLGYFLYININFRRASVSIQEDGPLLDSLQSAALAATEFASITQSFAFKNLEQIQNAWASVAPRIESIPFVGNLAKSAGLTDASKLSKIILNSTESTKSIVSELEKAIRSGNVKRIHEYTKQLSAAVQKLRDAVGQE